jgi:hypothetical protein
MNNACISNGWLSGDCTKEGGLVKGRRSIEDRSAKGAITTSKSSSRARRKAQETRDARTRDARRRTREPFMAKVQRGGKRGIVVESIFLYL